MRKLKTGHMCTSTNANVPLPGKKQQRYKHIIPGIPQKKKDTQILYQIKIKRLTTTEIYYHKSKIKCLPLDIYRRLYTHIQIVSLFWFIAIIRNLYIPITI